MKNSRELEEYGWFTTKVYSILLLFYRNTLVIDHFKQRVDTSKKILEIGSGTGRDYEALARQYDITGSDYSDAFVKTLRRKFKGHEFMKINALTMGSVKHFDVIFSNKVLHHLTPDQLEKSFIAQYGILNEGGLLFHTFWKGNPENKKQKRMSDVLYRREDIEKLKGQFAIEEYIEYKESKDDDSFIIILRK